MKSVFSVAILAFSIAVCACGPPKPAYNDVNPDQSGRNENRNSSATPPAPDPLATEPGSQGQAAPAQSKEIKPPAFLNQANGQIKNLPGYPNSIRRNVQYGPTPDQGTVKDTMSVLLETGDSMDQIADFYDKTIKSNGWTVADKLRDREVSTWNLKKGKDDEARVEIRKDPKSNSIFIALARTQTQPKQ